MKGKLLAVLITSALLTLSSAGIVSAQNRTQNRVQNEVVEVGRISPRPVESPMGLTRACQNIKTRSESLVKMANNMLTKFDSILASVQNYYTGTVVPSGKTVANYQNLVNDAQRRREAVQTALSTATTGATNLNCDGSAIRDDVLKYNKDMKVAKNALANYRTSIQKLIKAVYGFRRTTPSIRPKASLLPRASVRPRPSTSPRIFFSPKPDRFIPPITE
jgi:chromosome segregation ATPase